VGALARPLTLVFLGALAALLSVHAPAAAQGNERILSFDSRIEVHPDASMTVTETITILGQKKKFKRGIFRDFPTTYEGRHGETIRVDFEVLEVLRNGRPEPYHTEGRSNGVRVYAGQENVFIPAGEHAYAITYRTNRQLGFFEDFDELYWNVTGNDWAFVIDRASATVTLPPGARVTGWAAYTGPSGAQGRDYARGPAGGLFLGGPGGACPGADLFRGGLGHGGSRSGEGHYHAAIRSAGRIQPGCRALRHAHGLRRKGLHRGDREFSGKGVPHHRRRRQRRIHAEEDRKQFRYLLR
jgi:hypothetical protein